MKCLEQVKADPALRDVPIIMISALNELVPLHSDYDSLAVSG